jgi:hypothetical protein
MSHPVDDLLADFALGEPVPGFVRNHVSACATCGAEADALGSALVALRMPAVDLVPPPGRVWAAVRAELDPTWLRPRVAGDEVRPSGADPAHLTRPAHPLDAGVGAPAPVPSEAARPAAAGLPVPDDEFATRRARRAQGARPRRRFPVGWVAAAAAVGVIAGGAGVALWSARGDSGADRGVVLASARLDTLDTKQARGSAELLRKGAATDLAVRTSAITAGSGYVEVWLINRDLKRMVSIGVLAPGATTQTFPVPQALIDDGYVVVDVSREPLDGDSRHSGDSVVRGALSA